MEAQEPNRCWWCGSDPVYVAYHDQHWGRARKKDQEHFEMLTLECFQSGLSWISIWKRREGFRQAFAAWDLEKIAAFTADDVARLMEDRAIIRNRLKIEATIHNARKWPEWFAERGSFPAFAAAFAKDEQTPEAGFTKESMPLLTDGAHRMSAALKKRGFKFTGPMVCMSYLQAVGFLNHHIAGCFLQGQDLDAVCEATAP